jgi:hypothetical protein
MQQELTCNIYVFVLEDGKWLLALDPNPTVTSYFYRDVVRNNPIVKLDHIRYNLLTWQIDAYVHMYMHKHGLEHVRGGRYKNLELTLVEKDEISNAIKYFAYDIEEEFVQSEKFRELATTPDELENLLNKYKMLEDERKRFEIDRSVIDELEWLKEIMKTQVDRFLLIEDRYKKLMNSLSKIYGQFLRETENAQDKIRVSCELFLVKPYTFFDCRVIPSEREHNRYKFEQDAEVASILAAFETAIYTLINREDEAKYLLTAE